MGSSTVSAAEQAKSQQARQTNEPILDLNSILRGNKVKIVTGEEGVSEAYSLVVRVLAWPVWRRRSRARGPPSRRG